MGKNDPSSHIFGLETTETAETRQAFARLSNLRAPLLLLHAADDPFMRDEPALARMAATDPNLLVLCTRHGGHVGWPLANHDDKWLWQSTVVLSFSRAL